jgi:hypothetical protein
MAKPRVKEALPATEKLFAVIKESEGWVNNATITKRTGLNQNLKF